MSVVADLRERRIPNAVTLPALGPARSRLVFYRMPSPIGSLDQPNVLKDGVDFNQQFKGTPLTRRKQARWPRRASPSA